MTHPEFLPDDKIDSRALDIAQNVLGINPSEIFFISNDVTLEELSEFSLSNHTVQGHKQIKSTDIPTGDIHLYPGQAIDSREYVWYPPFSNQEIRSLCVRDRIRNVKKIEQAYGIKIKELKNIDVYPKLTISFVASYVDRALLKEYQLLNSSPS